MKKTHKILNQNKIPNTRKSYFLQINALNQLKKFYTFLLLISLSQISNCTVLYRRSTYLSLIESVPSVFSYHLIEFRYSNSNSLPIDTDYSENWIYSEVREVDGDNFYSRGKLDSRNGSINPIMKFLPNSNGLFKSTSFVVWTESTDAISTFCTSSPIFSIELKVKLFINPVSAQSFYDDLTTNRAFIYNGTGSMEVQKSSIAENDIISVIKGNHSGISGC